MAMMLRKKGGESYVSEAQRRYQKNEEVEKVGKVASSKERR